MALVQADVPLPQPHSVDRSWLHIQASVERRWNVSKIARRLLSDLPHQTGFEELRQLVKIQEHIGTGVYGKVYKANFAKRFRTNMPYMIAVKVVKIVSASKQDRAIVIEKVLCEIQAFSYVNGLVAMRICPNFTLVPRTFFTRIATTSKSAIPTFCCILVMECETGTFKEWLRQNQKAPPALVMGCILQIFMGILSIVQHLEMCHNDLYFKNILYSKCDPVDLVYAFNGTRTFVVRQCTAIMKLADFGIASSPKVLRSAHENLAHLMVASRRHMSSFVDYDFSTHILDFRNVQAYARDPGVVLKSISLTTFIDERVRMWAMEGLKRLDSYCRSNLMKVAGHSVNFIMEMFQPECLNNCGLDPYMFSPDAATATARQDLFDVMGHHVGKADVISDRLAQYAAMHHPPQSR